MQVKLSLLKCKFEDKTSRAHSTATAAIYLRTRLFSSFKLELHTSHPPKNTLMCHQSRKLKPSQFEVGFKKASNAIPQYWDGI